MIDKPLLAAVVALLTFSLMMSYSLSTYTVIHFHYSDFHFFIRQSIAVFIALMTMITISKMDPDRWFVPISMVLFILFFLLMIAMQFLPASLYVDRFCDDVAFRLASTCVSRRMMSSTHRAGR